MRASPARKETEDLVLGSSREEKKPSRELSTLGENGGADSSRRSTVTESTQEELLSKNIPSLSLSLSLGDWDRL